MFDLTLARLFAISGSVVALAELFYFSDGYLARQLLPIAVWAGGLMPLAYCIGKRLARSARAAGVLTVGLGMALALGLFGLWDVTFGPGREESLAGLVVIVMPAYQLAVLAVTLILARLT